MVPEIGHNAPRHDWHAGRKVFGHHLSVVDPKGECVLAFFRLVRDGVGVGKACCLYLFQQRRQLILICRGANNNTPEGFAT